MITDKDITEWRSLKGEGMISAIGEYTPEEFWDALDEIERLRGGCGEAYEKIAVLERLNEELTHDLAVMWRTFSHCHVNNGTDDFCKRCNLYLTHPVHLQSND